MMKPKPASGYQARRQAKFDTDKHWGAIVAWVVLELTTLLFDMYIAISAILELVYYKPDTYLSYQGWMIVIAARTGVAFGWALTATIIASLNAKAVSDTEGSLPCPELHIGVFWYWVMFSVWAVNLGFQANLFANRQPVNGNSQETAFITYMWLDIIAVIISGLEVLRMYSRGMLDMMLLKCKSPCYDL